MSYFLFLLLVVLKIADFLTTYIGIKYYGASEKNPVGIWMFSKFGMIGSFLIDSVLLFPLSYLYSFSKGSAPALFAMCLTQLVVDLSNIKVILEKRRGL